MTPLYLIIFFHKYHFMPSASVCKYCLPEAEFLVSHVYVCISPEVWSPAADLRLSPCMHTHIRDIEKAISLRNIIAFQAIYSIL